MITSHWSKVWCLEREFYTHNNEWSSIIHIGLVCTIFCAKLVDSLSYTIVNTLSGHYHYFKWTSHTRTVVRECCKGDEASQWRNPKFDPPPRPNPVSDRNTNRHTWLRRGPLHQCNNSSRSAQAFPFPRMRDFAHQNVLVFFFGGGSWDSLQPRAVDGFWREIRQNMRFRPRMCLFGVANIKSNI